jgi:hypothetical protein
LDDINCLLAQISDLRLQLKLRCDAEGRAQALIVREKGAINALAVALMMSGKIDGAVAEEIIKANLNVE